MSLGSDVEVRSMHGQLAKSFGDMGLLSSAGLGGKKWFVTLKCIHEIRVSLDQHFFLQILGVAQTGINRDEITLTY